MHFCTCMIRLGGDLLNVMPRTEFRPVSWPEIEVLRSLHGDSSVNEVKAFVRVDQSAKAEKERLRLIYGSPVVEEVFPGKNPQMELEMPGAKIPDQPPLWVNPILKDPAAFGVIDPIPQPKPMVKAKAVSPFN